jgi:hypothetical protein
MQITSLLPPAQPVLVEHRAKVAMALQRDLVAAVEPVEPDNLELLAQMEELVSHQISMNLQQPCITAAVAAELGGMQHLKV